MSVASTAAVGYAWNVFSSVNKMIGTQLSMLQSSTSLSTSLSSSSSSSTQSTRVISDEVLENRYDYTIKLLQALNVATTKIGNLIAVDTNRYHELSRIGEHLKLVLFFSLSIFLSSFLLFFLTFHTFF